MAKKIALDLIDESPTNPRKTFRGLEELADNIKTHGLLQAVLVRPKGDRFELVFGARRYRASKLAGLETIRANVRDLDDKAVIEIQLIENGKRDDIHPLEEADGFRVLHETHGYSVDDLAAKLGKSRSHVFSRLKLCELCEPARKAFIEGELSASTALLVARIPGDKLQREALKRLTAQAFDGQPISFRRAADIVQREFMCKLVDAPFDRKSLDLVAGAGACTTCPKRTGAQPELFEDVGSADVCTEPSCYAKKVDAHWKILQRDAKASGQKVLTGEEAKKAFPYSGSQPHGYVRLDRECYEDSKHRTYKQLAGKSLDRSKVVIARAPTGEIVEMLPEKVAKKLVPKRAPSKQEQAYKEQEKERREASAKREEEKRQQLEQLVAKAESTPLEVAWWHWLVGALADRGSCEEICKRRGIEYEAKKYRSSVYALTEAAVSMSVTQVRGLIVELLCSGYQPENRLAACDMYGVPRVSGDEDEGDAGAGGADSEEDDVELQHQADRQAQAELEQDDGLAPEDRIEDPVELEDDEEPATFHCPGCDKDVDEACGAYDDYPDLCDDCASDATDRMLNQELYVQGMQALREGTAPAKKSAGKSKGKSKSKEASDASR